MLDVELDAVLLRRLTRQAEVVDLPPVHVARFERGIGREVPVRGIAGVLVDGHAVLYSGVAPVAYAAEEPQAILLDRPAQAPAPVPVLPERGRLGDAHVLQIGVDVVGGGPIAGGAVEGAAGEPVAAGLRDHVDARAAGFRLAQAS